MYIACIDMPACEQVFDVLQRHGITAGTWWEGHAPLDERMWIHVNAAIDPTTEAAIQRDVEYIAGATIED